jgi:phosphoglycerol transferase MdoB-like AlkP superfamily enzyme
MPYMGYAPQATITWLKEKMMQKIFRHRFGPLAVLALLLCGIGLFTRIALLVKSWAQADLGWLGLPGVFLIGFVYDLVVASFFCIPVALYCWLMKDRWYRAFRVPLLLLFFLLIFILVLNIGSEWAFWDEFGVRYNFIAVDYLIYTTEVLGNIWQSYNIPLLLGGVLLVSILLLWACRRPLCLSQQVSMRFRRRSFFFVAFLLLPTAGYFLVNNRWKNFSNNNYVNELAGNGIYEFGAAFWHNEIDYDRFYATRTDTQNVALLQQLLQAPNVRFTGGPLSIEREVRADSPEHRWNVVLISVESLSGDYLRFFGNRDNITPRLDSLIPHSLFFTHFYASGTRTVRGLEALSLAIPPTPGQSIVRRQHNSNLFTLGNVLGSKGYEVKYIYGGNSFFDNMGFFFSSNGYRVIDQRDIPKENTHHTTAWGVCDEDIFTQALTECDNSYASGRLFFNHVMTVSNHRPYTYPDGRIDIPSATNSIQGGVKYTDYAIGDFLRRARQKPWFNNTLFVIVADHCSKSSGKTDLPVNRYHIPCWVYAPRLIQPNLEQRLTSQIDLAPSILGLLNLSYTSRFLGYDIFHTPAGRERVFISTYQDLGYIRNGQMVVLSPRRKNSFYVPEFTTGANQINNNPDTSLLNEAIAWYQGASFLYHTNRYRK